MRNIALFSAALVVGICSGASPALAGIVAPGPEAGVGLAAMSVVGTGYFYLKQRLNRH
jgi:hypothetical protein